MTSLWLEKLPNELITKIAFQMDPWSLMSLLKASPSLCKLFLLVVGPRLGAGTLYLSLSYPKFFEVKGLRWVNRDQLINGRPQETRALIKIYEINLPEPVHESDIMILQNKSPMDSYLICFGDFFIFQDETTWGSMERILADCVTYWCNQYQLCHPMFEELNRVTALNHIDTRHLRILEIEDIVRVDGIDLGMVRELTLVFSEPSDGSRPQFSNVTAVELRSLVIFYYDSPPLIQNINFGDDEKSGLVVLELYHVPSLRYDLNRALPVYPSSVEELDFSAVSSGQRLSKVNVVGGHDNILLQVKMDGITYLHWRQTCKQALPIPFLPSAPRLETFSFESLLPDASMPDCIDSEAIRSLKVIGYDGLVFDPGWLNFRVTRDLTVHCRGNRKTRAIPSLASLGHLVGWHMFSIRLVLDGLSAPPHGEDPVADRVVGIFANPGRWFSLQNVVREGG